MIKISLDVATKKTGYAIFKDNKYIKSGVIDTESKQPYFSDKVNDATFSVWNELKAEFSEFRQEKDIMLILETSIIYQKVGNFISAKTSEKLSIYTGLYIAVFKIFFHKSNIKIKMVSPSTWNAYYGISHMERKELKEFSIKTASNYTNKAIESDDEADAILLGIIGDKEDINDFWTIAHIRKQFKQHKESLNNKIKKTEALYNKYKVISEGRVKIGKKPFKQDADKVERYKEALEELKMQKEKINKPKEKGNEWNIKF